jgi:hypothetical protein
LTTSNSNSSGINVDCDVNITTLTRKSFKARTVQSLGIANILKLLRVSVVMFTSQSTLIPEELELEVVNSLHIV